MSAEVAMPLFLRVNLEQLRCQSLKITSQTIRIKQSCGMARSAYLKSFVLEEGGVGFGLLGLFLHFLEDEVAKR